MNLKSDMTDLSMLSYLLRMKILHQNWYNVDVSKRFKKFNCDPLL
jgi:hypothetical protein